MFERVGVAGLGEGGCAAAIGVVAGMSGQKINAPMNKKGLFPPKKHTPPSNRDSAILAQNPFYYSGGGYTVPKLYIPKLSRPSLRFI